MSLITIGGVPIKTTSDINRRLTLLIWGSSGCGKTTLAATAPGTKLWINFDPDGYNSLTGREDCLILDLSAMKSDIVNGVKDDDPFKVGRFLDEHPEVQTVVVDSVTAFAQQATAHSYQGARIPGATFENPGPGGYGVRNRFSLALVKAMLMITKIKGRHIVFVCHQDVPKVNEKGEVVGSTILLGGSLPEEVPLQVSEVWNMRESAGKRMITIRSTALMKPMKTRMFKTTGPIEFLWNYNPETDAGHKISDWYDTWIKSNGKIDLPK